MVWKCPKCSHTSRSYTAMMKHYYSKHHVSKAKSGVNKGKDKKKHIFHPLKRRK